MDMNDAYLVHALQEFTMARIQEHHKLNLLRSLTVRCTHTHTLTLTTYMHTHTHTHTHEIQCET